jgi:hypothetical protein
MQLCTNHGAASKQLKSTPSRDVSKHHTLTLIEGITDLIVSLAPSHSTEAGISMGFELRCVSEKYKRLHAKHNSNRLTRFRIYPNHPYKHAFLHCCHHPRRHGASFCISLQSYCTRRPNLRALRYYERRYVPHCVYNAEINMRTFAATLSDCQALVQPDVWNAAWAGGSNTCQLVGRAVSSPTTDIASHSWSSPTPGWYNIEAYNVACHGNCALNVVETEQAVMNLPFTDCAYYSPYPGRSATLDQEITRQRGKFLQVHHPRILIALVSRSRQPLRMRRYGREQNQRSRDR